MITFIQLIFNLLYTFKSKFRVWIYSHFFPIGYGTVILDGFNVRNPNKIQIGKRCFVNINCFIQGAGGVSIGDDVLIAPNVSFYSENHIFENSRKRINEQGFERKPIKIGNDVWIGANVVLLPGVILGDGCVIAAGAVITKSFPKNSVIGGVPGKLLKVRKN